MVAIRSIPIQLFVGLMRLCDVFVIIFWLFWYIESDHRLFCLLDARWRMWLVDFPLHTWSHFRQIQASGLLISLKCISHRRCEVDHCFVISAVLSNTNTPGLSFVSDWRESYIATKVFVCSVFILRFSVLEQHSKNSVWHSRRIPVYNVDTNIKHFQQPSC
jgi:hypothetical protein